MATEALAPLIAAMRDLTGWLASQSSPGMIIGGVAASILGRPRATRDIDALVLVPEEQWGAFLLSAGTFGFEARVAGALEFANRTRVLLLRHKASSVDLDVSLGILPFELEAVARRQTVQIAGIVIPITSPEDLVIMKAVAHRPRDMADIESVLAARPDLDRGRIRFWVEQFASALDSPELATDLERLL